MKHPDNNAKVPREDMATFLPKHFPINISDSIGVATTFQRLHWHDCLEINYIKQGSGYYLINGRIYEFKQGDILLINSNDLHRAYETTNLIMQVTVFEPSLVAYDQRYDGELLSPFTEIGIKFDNLLESDHPAMQELRSVMSEMQLELIGLTTSYKSIVRSLLLRFLAQVKRHFAKAAFQNTYVSRNKRENLQTVLMALEQRIDFAWTLKELSALICISPSSLSQLFNQIVGMSPFDYLIQLRLARAVHLMENTDKKIVEIAGECGFQNISNFNRLFLKYIGQSPMGLRKEG